MLVERHIVDKRLGGFWNMKKLLLASMVLGTMMSPALADETPAAALVPGVQLAQMSPPPPLLAPAWSGLYFGVNFGYDFAGSASPKVSFNDPTGGIGFAPYFGAGLQRFPKLTPSGFVGGAQIGYDWQFNNIVLGGVVDLDGSGARSSKTNFVPPNGFTPVTQGLSAKTSWLGTARVRLGFTPGPSWLVYGSGGLALGQVSASQTFLFPSPAPALSFSSQQVSETKAGWAAGGGFEYRISPLVGLGVDYIHYDLGSVRTRSNGTTFPAGASLPVLASLSVRQSFNGDIVRATLNFHLNAPPPPPPAPAAMPAPPPSAPVVFIVFFDWDKDRITPEGMAIIQQAAAAYKSGAPVQIQITGYTDRSGSPGYNQRLSERRANNVAKAMAALGVPKEQMMVSGKGENDNRVPTADGVREPQNRRVEIVKP